jgi:hypothetical protein
MARVMDNEMSATGEDTTADVSAKVEGAEGAEPSRALPEAARRALAEAADRRAKAENERPREIGGRGGEDPVRYGDWEVKGLAVDF